VNTGKPIILLAISAAWLAAGWPAVASGLARSPGQRPRQPNRPWTERERLWVEAQPRAEDAWRIEKACLRFEATRKAYQAVEKLRRPGCPAAVIYVLHLRESDCSFAHHLHEGSPLSGRTRWVPKGRPAKGNPPFTWQQSAEDALYVIKSYHDPAKWRSIDSTLDWIERYNGTGYRRRGIPSPYLVAASTLQKRGKYVADGRFSASAWDCQLGCLIVLKRLAEKRLYDPPPWD
jgi:lysozyme family protein